MCLILRHEMMPLWRISLSHHGFSRVTSLVKVLKKVEKTTTPATYSTPIIILSVLFTSWDTKVEKEGKP